MPSVSEVKKDDPELAHAVMSAVQQELGSDASPEDVADISSRALNALSKLNIADASTPEAQEKLKGLIQQATAIREGVKRDVAAMATPTAKEGKIVDASGMVVGSFDNKADIIKFAENEKPRLEEK